MDIFVFIAESFMPKPLGSDPTCLSIQDARKQLTKIWLNVCYLMVHVIEAGSWASKIDAQKRLVCYISSSCSFSPDRIHKISSQGWIGGLVTVVIDTCRSYQRVSYQDVYLYSTPQGMPPSNFPWKMFPKLNNTNWTLAWYLPLARDIKPEFGSYYFVQISSRHPASSNVPYRTLSKQSRSRPFHCVPISCPWRTWNANFVESCKLVVAINECER